MGNYPFFTLGVLYRHYTVISTGDILFQFSSLFPYFGVCEGPSTFLKSKITFNIGSNVEETKQTCEVQGCLQLYYSYVRSFIAHLKFSRLIFLDF
jgi:hypothetical protein